MRAGPAFDASFDAKQLLALHDPVHQARHGTAHGGREPEEPVAGRAAGPHDQPRLARPRLGQRKRPGGRLGLPGMKDGFTVLEIEPGSAGISEPTLSDWYSGITARALW